MTWSLFRSCVHCSFGTTICQRLSKSYYIRTHPFVPAPRRFLVLLLRRRRCHDLRRNIPLLSPRRRGGSAEGRTRHRELFVFVLAGRLLPSSRPAAPDSAEWADRAGGGARGVLGGRGRGVGAPGAVTWGEGAERAWVKLTCKEKENVV